MVINFQTLFFTYELGNLLTFWNFHKITFESVERKDNVFHLPLYNGSYLAWDATGQQGRGVKPRGTG